MKFALMAHVPSAFLDIRSPILPSRSNPLGLVLGGLLLAIAIFFLGRLLWKRGKNPDATKPG